MVPNCTLLWTVVSFHKGRAFSSWWDWLTWCQERECLTHWGKVWQNVMVAMCLKDSLVCFFSLFSLSLSLVWPTWPLWWARVYQRKWLWKLGLNWWLKEGCVSVCMSWLANHGLLLKSWWHMNCKLASSRCVPQQLYPGTDLYFATVTCFGEGRAFCSWAYR